MNKKRLSKVLAWVAGAIATLSASNQFGKFSGIAGMVATGLTAWSVSLASETSAGHPNGLEKK